MTASLDPRIEAVREAYGLDRDDFWQIPQNKQWVCKHAALEVVATKANVEWDLPQVIQADTANGIAVIVASGKMGKRVEWATGEANPKNNKNSYPWAMAEKRAKDRVVLKLVGIHGLVYSEDEADDFKSAETRTTDRRSEVGRQEADRQDRSAIDNLWQELNHVSNMRGLQSFWTDNLDAVRRMDDFNRKRFTDKKETLKRQFDKAADKTVADIGDTFPGANVVDERIVSTLQAGE